MKIADMLVFLKQSRQTAFENGFCLIFIKLGERQRLWKRETVSFERLADEPSGIFLTNTWTDAHAVEDDTALRPILTESSCLRFAELRQLVIVRLKEGSLRMADDKESSHC